MSRKPVGALPGWNEGVLIVCLILTVYCMYKYGNLNFSIMTDSRNRRTRVQSLDIKKFKFVFHYFSDNENCSEALGLVHFQRKN